VGIIDSDLHESCLRFRERVPFELKRLCRRILLAAIAPREKLFPFVQGHLRRAFPALRDTREVESTTPSLERVQAASMDAFRSYRPQTYGGSATFFQAKVRRIKFLDPHPACSLRIWSRLVEEGLVVKEVPGGHTDLLREPHVAELARELSASLQT